MNESKQAQLVKESISLLDSLGVQPAEGEFVINMASKFAMALHQELIRALMAKQIGRDRFVVLMHAINALQVKYGESAEDSFRSVERDFGLEGAVTS